MGQRGSEKGIREDVDYGTKFLDARKGDGGSGGGGDDLPPPTPDPVPLPSGRSVGQIVLFLVLALTVIAGGVGLFVLTDGGDDPTGDLISEGGTVQIADHDRPTTTTTTRPTTTTEAPTTTTTLAPTTVTTTPGQTTVPNGGTIGPVVVTTLAPACPSGGVSSSLAFSLSSVSGGKIKIDFANSSTTNSTTGAIKLTLEVPITYVDASGATKTVSFRPDQYGQTVAAGATIQWSGAKLVDTIQQPTPSAPTGSWAWADPAQASCPVGTFG